jgi:hypothetical protein
MAEPAGGNAGLARSSNHDAEARPMELAEDAPLFDAADGQPFTFMHQLYRDQVDLLLDEY